jgi:hypothetical protein
VDLTVCGLDPDGIEKENQVMSMYQDQMDQTRVVKPLRQEGKSYVCAIYWRSHGDLNYGGTANIPLSLFDDSPQNRHIGFVPYKD